MNFLHRIIKRIVGVFLKILLPKTVFIYDYPYSPKYRKSFENSKINDFLEEWYENNLTEILYLAKRLCSYETNYKNVPFTPGNINVLPHWINNYLPQLDAISIYGFLAEKNPRYYIEVGSGNTTKFAALSISDNNLRTKIISIDPYPRSEIDKLCHKIYRSSFEDMDLNFFGSLTDEDILLVDNSHRSFPNSDVTVFFLEVLPKLPSGLLYSLHDICLPYDYPEIWTVKEKRFYNEQYMLCSYILGGAGGDKFVLPNAFLSNKKGFISVFDSLYGEGKLFNPNEKKVTELSGSLFWMQKG